jgi:mono/diheme cytochrome c family protein
MLFASLGASLGILLALMAPAHADDGPALYDRLCLACHGAKGDGQGPAAPWLWPRPRDLTTGELKWQDAGAAIRWGVPGAMPAFGVALDDAQIDSLALVVRGLAGKNASKPARARAVPAGTGDAERGAKVWAEAGCTSCHGADGKGATAAAPYDLTASPLRRPHAPGGEADALYRSIAWGVSGTAMPGFESALSSDDVWALVAYVMTMQPAAPPVAPGRIPPEAIAADRAGTLTRAGYRPGDPADPEHAVWGVAIAPQGAPPASLSPAQANLSAKRCARCHASQARDWSETIHARAMSVGMRAQLSRVTKPASLTSCLRCHSPLAEQHPDEAGYDRALQDEGVTCASCHLRGWTRHGPSSVSASLLSLPTYPTRPLALYERSDFCLPCHQLQPRSSVEGRPLLDTYREWLTGPYMPRGVQCQHCHMPNREHTWKGIHDPDTFRQGYRLEAIAARGASGVVSVRARLWNVGAGHLLPTTPTPAAWLEVELVDARGRAIAGAKKAQRIGRDIVSTKNGWVEKEDTRIAPGASLEVAAGWKNGRVAEATHARITVRVHPDDYYERLYRGRLKGALTDQARADYQAALERSMDSRYLAEERLVPLE